MPLKSEKYLSRREQITSRVKRIQCSQTKAGSGNDWQLNPTGQCLSEQHVGCLVSVWSLSNGLISPLTAYPWKWSFNDHQVFQTNADNSDNYAVKSVATIRMLSTLRKLVTLLLNGSWKVVKVTSPTVLLSRVVQCFRQVQNVWQSPFNNNVESYLLGSVWSAHVHDNLTVIMISID